MKSLEIQTMKLDDLIPADYNPRLALKPGDSEYESLKKSISTFGYVLVLVLNRRTKRLVSGHQSLSVLKDLGFKEVEVRVVDLSPEKEKALNIALNKIRGDWDEEKLSHLLKELNELPDFDLETTGFSADEMSRLFEDYFPDLSDGDDLVESPEDLSKPVITQMGQLIKLGPHRLICGDSSDQGVVNKLMEGEKASMLYTDPPFNCAYKTNARPGASKKPDRAKILNDSMDQAEYVLWLRDILKGAKEHLISGGAVYIWNGHRQFGPMHSMLSEGGFYVSNVIVWVKPCPSPGYGDYQMQCEFAIYGWLKGGKTHEWHGPKDETNVWDVSRDPVNQLIHPTQKPVMLAERAIRNSTKPGDVVLDLFLGSGATLIAADKLGRSLRGVELDPRYCDGIIRRYLRHLGREKADIVLWKEYMGD